MHNKIDTVADCPNTQCIAIHRKGTKYMYRMQLPIEFKHAVANRMQIKVFIAFILKIDNDVSMAYWLFRLQSV